MNILSKVLILVVVLGSLVFSRSGANRVRGVDVSDQSKNKHFWVVADDIGDEIDRRKRSHKRRRKIKRPRKGLR